MSTFNRCNRFLSSPRSPHRRATVLVASVLLVSLTDSAAFADPRLITDLQTAPAGSRPTTFVELDGRVVFDATTPAFGRELWISDGTQAGTRLLVDTVPGPAGSTTDNPHLADRLVRAVGSRLFYSAETDRDRLDLWVVDSDGRGERLVDGLRALAGEHEGRLIFERHGANGEIELWTSAGTASTTERLSAFAEASVTTQAATWARFGDQLTVVGEDTEGCRWWTVDPDDGTAAPFATLASGPCDDLDGYRAVVFDDRLYFTGWDAEHGQELWASDGTAAGSQLVADLESGPDSSRPWLLDAVGERLLFFSRGPLGSQSAHTLWRLDRSDSSPQRLLADAEPRRFYRFDFHVPLGDRLLFVDRYNQELWASDGTLAGTDRVADANAARGGWLLRQEGRSDRAVFLALTPFDMKIWVSDGTPGGTHYLPEIDLVGNPEQSPGIAAGKIWVAGETSDRGAELWASDGSLNDQRLVADLDTSGTEDAFLSQLVSIGDRAYFIFESSDGTFDRSLWTTDGTEPGTVPIAVDEEIAGRFRRQSAAAHEGRLVFVGNAGVPGQELFVVDGEGSPTAIDLAPGSEGFHPVDLLSVDDTLYVATTRGLVPALWRLDGETPTRVATLAPPDEQVSYQARGVVRLHRFGQRVAIVVETQRSDDVQTPTRRLWISDGTSDGTRALTEIRGSGARADEVAVWDDRLVFDAWDDAEGQQLWATDGTVEGTGPLLDLTPGPDDRWASFLTPTEHGLYVSARIGSNPCPSIWRLDRGATEAIALHDCALRMRAVGSSIVFVHGDDPLHGEELWRIAPDGSRRLLIDLEPGPEGSSIVFLGTFGGRLYFQATTSAIGSEVYSTDGTAEGTRLEGDVAPGIWDSRPRDMVGLGGGVMWLADDSVHGVELWHNDLRCDVTSETQCLGGGRFQLSTGWRAGDGAGRDAGAGRVAELTDDTGGFWFFDDANVETVVKVLDGTAINGHHWLFLASLSNIAFTLDVVDTETGKAWAYANPDGTFASFGDVEALPAEARPAEALPAEAMPAEAMPAEARPAEALPAEGLSGGSGRGTSAAGDTRPALVPLVFGPADPVLADGPCAPAADLLCLDDAPGDGRFRLRVTWRDPAGAEGVGAATPWTANTGGFWFFDPSNVEVLVKLLDARAINGHFWVYLGSLSNVQFELQVEDTTTGQRAVYINPLGRFASFGDVEALPATP